MGAILSGLWLSVALAAQAAPGEERWVASSKTAMSITGDITLSPTQLRMAGNTVLPLRVAADIRGFPTEQGPQSVRLLAVTRPANPPLLRGNTFCNPAARWIAVWHMPDGGLGMAVFSDETQPQGEKTSGFCGSYYYSRP